MNTYFNSNVIWLQLEYKMPTLVSCLLPLETTELVVSELLLEMSVELINIHFISLHKKRLSIVKATFFLI